ncbi:MAG: transcription termination/antitermination protein NusG [Gemmataceae bacterium]
MVIEEPNADSADNQTVEQIAQPEAAAPAEAPAVPPRVLTSPDPDLPPPTGNRKWYVVKVASSREDSIKDAIEKRLRIEGLQDYFGEIVIPTEKVTEMRKNKRVVKERKLYPGYLMVNVEFNDRILLLFRETTGVGDFVGGSLGKLPPPMTDREVERMLGQMQRIDEVKDQVPTAKFDRGDRIKVRDGTFAGMEGEVKEVLADKGSVRVELTIFGRPVPVELEYWQVDYT